MKTRTGGAVPIMNQYDTCQLVQKWFLVCWEHWLNVGPTLAQCWANIGSMLGQRWINVGPTLGYGCTTVGPTLGYGCATVGPTLSYGCATVGPTLAQCWVNVGTSIFFVLYLEATRFLYSTHASLGFFNNGLLIWNCS